MELNLFDKYVKRKPSRASNVFMTNRDLSINQNLHLTQNTQKNYKLNMQLIGQLYL